MKFWKMVAKDEAPLTEQELYNWALYILNGRFKAWRTGDAVFTICPQSNTPALHMDVLATVDGNEWFNHKFNAFVQACDQPDTQYYTVDSYITVIK
jgi:hypothetical protein